MNTAEERSERLFRAIGGVGGDLIDLAERRTFRPGLSRRLLPVAACLAVLLALGAVLPSIVVEKETVLRQEAPAAAEPTAEEPVSESPMSDCHGDNGLVGGIKEHICLTVQGTVYYAEGIYPPENVRLGQLLGTVEDADDALLQGASVYEKKDSVVLEGQTLPLELFVDTAAGFCYCLTYYLPSEPAPTLQEAIGLSETDTQTFTETFAIGMAFESGEQVAREDLIEFFLRTLELEKRAGKRTDDLNRYLWYDETYQQYRIPEWEVRRQLDRYLSGYRWNDFGSAWYGYGTDSHVLVLEDLEPENWEEESFAAAVFDGERLLLTTDRHTYAVRFTEGCCIYESVTER